MQGPDIVHARTTSTRMKRAGVLTHQLGHSPPVTGQVRGLNGGNASA